MRTLLTKDSFGDLLSDGEHPPAVVNLSFFGS